MYSKLVQMMRLIKMQSFYLKLTLYVISRCLYFPLNISYLISTASSYSMIATLFLPDDNCVLTTYMLIVCARSLLLITSHSLNIFPLSTTACRLAFVLVSGLQFVLITIYLQIFLHSYANLIETEECIVEQIDSVCFVSKFN